MFWISRTKEVVRSTKRLKTDTPDPPKEFALMQPGDVRNRSSQRRLSRSCWLRMLADSACLTLTLSTYPPHDAEEPEPSFIVV